MANKQSGSRSAPALPSRLRGEQPAPIRGAILKGGVCRRRPHCLPSEGGELDRLGLQNSLLHLSRTSRRARTENVSPSCVSPSRSRPGSARKILVVGLAYQRLAPSSFFAPAGCHPRDLTKIRCCRRRNRHAFPSPS